MQSTLLVLVGGPTASGKSYIARKLVSRIASTFLVDKDTATGDLVNALLVAKGEDSRQRDTPLFWREVRPLEYSTMMALVKENLELGKSVVAAAPFIYELSDQRWLDQLASSIPSSIQVWRVWVDADEATMKERMFNRRAAYDGSKIADWSTWAEKLRGFPKPVKGQRFISIRNSLSDAATLTEQIDSIAEMLSNNAGMN